MDDIRSTKYYSSIQEKRVAEYLNWGVVSGSGSRAGKPGDIIGAHFLGECKTHTEPGHQIVFNSNVWDKIKREAESCFSFPVLISDDGSQKLDKTWCLFLPFVVPEYGRFADYNEVNSRVNLIFDGDKALEAYKDAFYTDPDFDPDAFGVFKVTLNQEKLCMCPLPEFKTVFGDA